MNPLGNKIKNTGNLNHTIQRIAYQILEKNSDYDQVVIAGITTNGSVFGKKLCEVLSKITACKFILMEVFIDKEKPINSVTSSVPLDKIKNHPVVIVDDVLNSGSTLMYAVNYFLQVPLEQLQTAVIVNRNHKKYPIKADFKGISLSTSLKEHIQVVLEGEEQGIYLS